MHLLDETDSENRMVRVVNTGAVGWLPEIFIVKAADEDVKKAPKTAKGKEKEALHQRE